jgi:hypothetical protein
VRLKVALASQQLVELLNVLSTSPGWSREAVARAVCSFDREQIIKESGDEEGVASQRSAPSTCAAEGKGSFAGLDLNALNYSSYVATTSIKLQCCWSLLASVCFTVFE